MKPIILIGGVAGTGKTTLSNLLLQELNIDHKIGLGWIRETLCTVLKKEEYPELFGYSFQTADMNNIKSYYVFNQTMYHKQAIEACINRANREGTSLIIEGVNLVPGIIDTKYVSNYFWLKMLPDINVHKNLLTGETHKNRRINQDDLLAIRKIGEFIERDCINHGVDLVEFDTQEKRLEYIISKIKKANNESIL